MPKLVNWTKNKNCYYIGRKRFGYHFGNPFSHKPDSMASVIVDSIEEAVARFKTWLNGESDLDLEQDRRRWILEHLHLLRDKDLGCYGCQPVCHGEVYLEMLYG